MTFDDELAHKRALQEDEYRLPHHWILRKHGLVNYHHKTDVMAELIHGAGVRAGPALDVGCGDGRGTYELTERLGPDFAFTGVDFSDRAIAFARLMAADITFEVQDGERLAFDDDAFGLVVAREVIEHVPPDGVASFVSELARVVRRDGGVLVTTPSVNRRVPEKHFQHFTELTLGEALAAGGLRVDQTVGVGWFPSSPRVERWYRTVISLPALWRLDAYCGTRRLPPARADGLIVLARPSHSPGAGADTSLEDRT